MKVYKIIANDWWYDQYDSIAVLAESKERALELAEMKHKDNYYLKFFKSDQYPLRVEELDMTKEQIILSSYNAG